MPHTPAPARASRSPIWTTGLVIMTMLFIKLATTCDKHGASTPDEKSVASTPVRNNPRIVFSTGSIEDAQKLIAALPKAVSVESLYTSIGEQILTVEEDVTLANAFGWLVQDKDAARYFSAVSKADLASKRSHDEFEARRFEAEARDYIAKLCTFQGDTTDYPLIAARSQVFLHPYSFRNNRFYFRTEPTAFDDPITKVRYSVWQPGLESTFRNVSNKSGPATDHLFRQYTMSDRTVLENRPEAQPRENMYSPTTIGPELYFAVAPEQAEHIIQNYTAGKTILPDDPLLSIFQDQAVNRYVDAILLFDYSNASATVTPGHRSVSCFVRISMRLKYIIMLDRSGAPFVFFEIGQFIAE